MKVLFAVSECVPFVKSGGLADVAGSLPKELKKLGTDVRIVLPKYGSIPDTYKKKMKKIREFSVSVGWRNQYCGIEELVHDGVIFYFVDNEYYFLRDQLYGYFDDGERFAYFSRAVLESIRELDFYPDIIHCHDWHTGMIPFLLNVQYRHAKEYASIKSVFTIHNLQFQGIMPKEALTDLFGLDELCFNAEQLEFYGCINFMKAALTSADKITTVSPTYKAEIQNEYYGEKLDGLLRLRDEDLTGILNGIDADFYDPENDQMIAAPYNVNLLTNKGKNKLSLQKLAGLPEQPEVPIIAMITRLTSQKGLDLVKCVFQELMSEEVQFVVLGTGEDEFEQFFAGMEQVYPEKVRAYIRFNEELAHKIYAGADLFLMPSRFEPCGLGQLIAMRYGTIPVVRETGGLNDTVHSYNGDAGEGNGFSFTNFNAHDMLHTINRAIYFYSRKEEWKELVKKTMSLDYSWAQSAFKYSKLYEGLVSGE